MKPEGTPSTPETPAASGPAPAPAAVPAVRALFLAALDIADPDQRLAYLASACGQQPELRRRVEALLARHTDETRAGGGPISAGAEARPPVEEAGTRIGRYQLLERLGEGGFGTVWMAEQREPVQRRVALKIIKLGMDTREVVARFEAERQALALMDHPGIARVFDGGATETGRPFFVMELVRGLAITEFCERRRLTIPDRLALFVQVCEAVQHAHQRGIIHRDLKPSNVLVAEIDGRPQPKVIDFGIAKATGPRLSADPVFTRFHQVIGTPAYMSPEQTGGAPDDLDTRSDIYSLGVLLYELLTGRPPFDTRQLLEAGLDAVLRVLREREPARPSTRLGELTRDQLADVATGRQSSPEKLGRLLRGELDWIVMKALEKERARRYVTAQDFAADLRRFLVHEPVLAAPPSAAYRFRKFARRNRVLVTTSAIIALTLAVATAVSLRLAFVADHERDRARAAQANESEARTAAERHAEEARQRLVALNVGHGQLRQQRGDAFGALVWFADALVRDAKEATRRPAHLARLRAVLASSPRLALIAFHDGPVLDAAFSHDGARFATAGADGAVRVWEVASGAAVGTARAHAGPVREVQFSPDDHRLLTVCDDRTARVWDVATGHPISPAWNHRLPIRHAAFTPDGTRVLVATSADRVRPGAGENGDGRRDESEIHAWNPESGEPSRAPLWRASALREMVLDPGGRRLAAGYADGTIELWTLPGWIANEYRRTPPSAPSLPGTPAPATGPTPWFGVPDGGAASGIDSLVFSPDGARLFVLTDEAAIETWEIQADGAAIRAVTRLPGSRGTRREPAQLACSPDGHHLLTREPAGALRLWRSDPPSLVGEPPLFAAADRGANFSPDGLRVVAVGGLDESLGAARIGEVLAGRAPGPFLSHSGRVRSARWDPEGQRLLTAGDDGLVRLWDLTHDAATEAASDPNPAPDGSETPERWVNTARVLSGRALDAAGGLMALPLAQMRSGWEELRALPPPALRPHPDARRQWRIREATRAEAAEAWFAAERHLTALVAESPEDAELRRRLARARTRAALDTLNSQP